MNVPSEPPAFEVRLTEMVFPALANHYGTLFAGEALSLMVKAAFVAASRRVRGNVVLRAAEAIELIESVPVGRMLELVAMPVAEGLTSLTIAVEGHAETIATGERRPAMRGRFVMVAIDEQGGARPLDA